MKVWGTLIAPGGNSLIADAFNALSSSVFLQLYVPVKIPTASGMPNDYTYTRLFSTVDEIVAAYKMKYLENYFVVDLIPTDGIDVSYEESVLGLYDIIDSVYTLNKAKYLKLAELLGMEWNPLWNVDGSEEYTYLENEGVNDISVSKSYTQHTDTLSNGNTRSGSVSNSGSSAENHTDTESVTTFDDPTWNDTVQTAGNANVTSDSSTTTYNNVTDTGSGSTTYGAHTDTDTTTVTHHNALNGTSEYSGGTDAFGNTVVGGDKYHTEKRVRHGNIGVTKTTELINDAIETYRNNLLQEFFDDLNKVALVRLFDL